MDVSFALSVIFTGVTIVFIVLVILIFVMYLLGQFAGEKPKTPSVAAPAETRRAPEPAPVVKAAPKMAVEDGIGDETVAVIAAAVASFTQGAAGRIVSVRQAHGKRSSGESGRGAWSMAGLRENTQPF